MGAGASASDAPPSLKVTGKEAKRLQKQAKSAGLNKEIVKQLFTAFGMLPSFADGTALAQEVSMLPHIAPVPLFGRISRLYANEQGRIRPKDLLNMITEWGESGGDGEGPKPLSPEVRLKKVFQAFDGDGDDHISLDEMVAVIDQLTSGAVDEDNLRQALLTGPAAKFMAVSDSGVNGLSFEKFRQIVSAEDLADKTTIRL